ncbi:type I pantothenate kinase [Sediminibacillus albus]|uniref:Pantothenate kinase n=1 Tax=Sediminibacillus albus TaxID=407036 RepID=A0A1G8VHD6_9BACI|nr:type I pantothenate kinase [Sediminibacillus albus]SDJ65458.1 pantothenate kinase [Sediminibacillus albus]
MVSEKFSPYISFNREEWSRLRFNTPLTLTKAEIKELQGINERLSVEEVKEIYLPLTRLLNLYINASQQLHSVTDQFFGQATRKVPYIIGIAGSVAVGKSTTSRILQSLLSRLPEHPKVQIVTTDGFLYPNQVLKQKGLMEKKGFPESYDIKKLINFLSDLKSGRDKVSAPVYSHFTYDILPEEAVEVEEADIVIIEGINVLQTPSSNEMLSKIYVSDFFDLSLFVDAEEEDIQRWYIERFKILKESAFKDPKSYFNRYASLSDFEAEQVAAEIWNNINKKNLDLNIYPTKYRANIIIKKGKDHLTEQINLRKV